MKVFSFHFLCGEYLSPKIMTTQNVTKGPCLDTGLLKGLETKLAQFRLGLKTNKWYFCKRKEREIWTPSQSHIWKTSCGDRGRDWRGESIKPRRTSPVVQGLTTHPAMQGTRVDPWSWPRLPGATRCQKTQEGYFPDPSEPCPADTLISDLWPPKLN